MHVVTVTGPVQSEWTLNPQLRYSQEVNRQVFVPFFLAVLTTAWPRAHTNCGGQTKMNSCTRDL